MSSERYVELDVMKGFLAILVVVGHAIQQYEIFLGAGWGACRTVIYSFHMAAFVFAAGFCSGKVLSFCAFSDVLAYLKARAFRLLLPYMFWGVVYYVLRMFASDCARIPYDWSKTAFFLLGYNPDGAMWFLWALFAASAIIAAVARGFLRGWIAVLLLWILSAASMCLRLDADYLRGIRALPVFIFFLSLGLHVNVNYATARRVFESKFFVVVCMAAFAASCCARQYGWCVGVPWYAVSAPTGAMLTMSVSFFIVARLSLVSAGLALLGKYAMAVYVIGEPVKVACRIGFAKLGVPVSVSLIMMMVATLAISVIIARLLTGRSRVLSALMLGENQRGKL